MKKFFVKILCGLLCVSMLLSATACSEGKWAGSKMKAWGEVQSVGGFVAETENYLYYLNGVANSSADNTLGKPVKGALMAVDKSDLTKTEIAVPKLFAATDYDAGVYIFGDYVYYGSPSTDKTPEGTIAKSEMMFMRSKLDGTDTKTLFTVSNLSVEYRMVEKDGAVYIVYYDANNTELISYNAKTGAKTVIAKTDVKTSGNESLKDYVLLDNGALDTAVVLYTVTVYSEKYDADKIEDSSIQRTEYGYNKVYAYSAGDVKADGAEMVGKCVYDGTVENSNEGDTYAVTLATEDYVFYTKTDRFGAVKNYGLSVEDFCDGKVGQEVVADYVVATNLFVSLEEVYVLDSDSSEENAENTVKKIYKDTMIKANATAESKKLVALGNTISTLLFVNGNYVYYYNTSNQIARIDVTLGEDAVEERVSEDTVALTWYDPELITIGSVTYLFYCDNSASGLSYIKYVDIATVATAEDTDDDGENDKFYLEGANFMGKILDADKADMYEAVVSKIAGGFTNGVLNFDLDENGDYKLTDGKLSVKAVEDARAQYEALAGGVKEKVSSSTLKTLKKYEDAIEIASLLYKLDGIIDYDNLSETEQQSFKTIYESIKDAMNKHYASSDWSSIDNVIDVNLKANYSKAVAEFEEKK